MGEATGCAAGTAREGGDTHAPKLAAGVYDEVGQVAVWLSQTL